MTAAIRLLAIDSLVCTVRADALYNIRYVLHLKSLWYLHHRDMLLFEAEGLTTLQAGQMHMLALLVRVMSFLLLAHAVFLLSAAIVNDMQHLLLCKQGQGAEDSAPVRRGQQRLQVAQRKGKVQLRQRAPNENPHCRGSHAMILQMLCNFFCHCLIAYRKVRCAPKEYAALLKSTLQRYGFLSFSPNIFSKIFGCHIYVPGYDIRSSVCAIRVPGQHVRTSVCYICVPGYDVRSSVCAIRVPGQHVRSFVCAIRVREQHARSSGCHIRDPGYDKQKSKKVLSHDRTFSLICHC